MTKNARPTDSSGPDPGRDIKGRFQPGHQYGFRPGTSGNPGGRSQRDREVAAMFDVLTPRAIEILGELAEQRDLTALKTIVERSIAPPKSQTVQIDLGPLANAADCQVALTRISQALAAGEIAPGDLPTLNALIETAQRVNVATDQEARLQKVEATLKDTGR